LTEPEPDRRDALMIGPWRGGRAPVPSAGGQRTVSVSYAFYRRCQV